MWKVAKNYKKMLLKSVQPSPPTEDTYCLIAITISCCLFNPAGPTMEPHLGLLHNRAILINELVNTPNEVSPSDIDERMYMMTCGGRDIKIHISLASEP